AAANAMATILFFMDHPFQIIAPEPTAAGVRGSRPATESRDVSAIVLNVRQRRTSGTNADNIPGDPLTASSDVAVARGRNALLPLFIVSGCAALIYEVVWYQSLSLIIGSSAVSMAVVLATYMGGMGLGSLVYLRWRGRFGHPLRIYAQLELLIAVFALLVLYVLPWAGGLYTSVGGGGFTGLLLRGLFCAIFLLPPTMAMGATLPAAAGWLRSTPEGVSRAGFYYTANIAGGVIGCLLAGFLLLRVYDIHTATWVGVALNVLVAGVAFMLSRLTPAAPVESAGGATAAQASAAADHVQAAARKLPAWRD